MLHQRERDEDPVGVVCRELASWLSVYSQERAEGPLQFQKAADLMPTVMAWLHSENHKFDCRSTACALALPQTAMREGSVNTRMHVQFADKLLTLCAGSMNLLCHIRDYTCTISFFLNIY